MDLLEYQAKKLFRQVGIPILPSQTIKEPRQIKQLQIPYPVVLKSQVRAGGRGKAGGVRFVANTIDAIAATRNIFNLSILGEYPDVVLAEARYDAHKELFLAIALDYQLKRPVLLGSSSGGMDVKLLLKNLQKVVIETEFSPFYARRLASRMNLSGELLLSVSNIIEKLYSLFQEKDLELVEINPLGVNSEGKLMALDGKMTINQNALSRHPEIVTLSNSVTGEPNSQWGSRTALPSVQSPNSIQKPSQVQWLDWQDSKGEVAIIANDFELAVLSWDLVCQEKQKPACAAVLNHNFWHDDGEIELFREQLQDIFEQLESSENIKLIFINIWASQNTNDAIAQTVVDYYQTVNDAESSTAIKQKNKKKSASLKVIIRLVDQEINRYQEKFEADNIYWTTDLEDAIAKLKD